MPDHPVLEYHFCASMAMFGMTSPRMVKTVMERRGLLHQDFSLLTSGIQLPDMHQSFLGNFVSEDQSILPSSHISSVSCQQETQNCTQSSSLANEPIFLCTHLYSPPPFALFHFKPEIIFAPSTLFQNEFMITCAIPPITTRQQRGPTMVVPQAGPEWFPRLPHSSGSALNTC